MSIKTNFGQVSDPEYPRKGVATAYNVNFKNSQTVLIASPAQRQFLLSSVILVSTAISALSNGATVVVQEHNLGTKTAATLSTSMTGANNDIVLTAVNKGVVGNSITLTLVAPGTNNAALGIVVTGTNIVANLATDGSAAITTTASQLLAALAASAPAAALVTGALKGSDTGATAVTALATTSLTGGLEYSVVQGIIASTNLANSDSVGKTQVLTHTFGHVPITPGNQIAVVITAGTATTDEKNILIDGFVL